MQERNSMPVAEGPHPLDAADPETGVVRVCASRCSSCIFASEDDPARYPISDAERDAWTDRVAAEDGYVVCHDSGQHRPAGAPAAICHGFWVRYRRQSLMLEFIARFARTQRVDPPDRPAYPRTPDPA
ncbi:hypothetical protein SAMN05216298_0322 [Glycomyces sambucus]|uniref:Uncharacterized protein n=2 Tax=Glycomyces sambucus TaxID=380244 RepID=A0A1G9CGC7_9ACTN|nr:hypothetical protein SAMN05216298_0322 [Glycomyces sambucus]